MTVKVTNATTGTVQILHGQSAIINSIGDQLKRVGGLRVEAVKALRLVLQGDIVTIGNKSYDMVREA